MLAITDPGHFPSSVRYCFAAETEISRHLARILALLSPKSECLGFTPPEAGDSDSLLVICDGDWMATRDKWISGGGDSDRLVILLPAVGDPWDWWEFSKAALDKLQFDGEVKMSLDDFVDVLVNRLERATFDENGALRLNHFSYLTFLRDRYDSHLARIKEVEDRLSDDQSKRVYRTLFSEPQSIWNHYLSRVFSSSQYFDHIDYSKCHTVLNGGIWLGFELPQLFSVLPDDAVVHNIDPFGHDHLSAHARPTVEAVAERCVLHRVALSDRTGSTTLKVMADGQANTANAESEGVTGPNVEFPCITVDQLVQDNRLSGVDLIKFDLEGGEIEAVQGMAETIRRFRPQLAISIYHFLNDYWDLASYLMDLCPDYNYHIGHYSYERFETVLYCIPKELADRQPA